MALALLAAACGAGDPATTPAAPTVTVSTVPQTTAAPSGSEPADAAADAVESADAPSAGATAAVADGSGAEVGSADAPSGELRWSDVLGSLSVSAESCIRQSLGEDDLEAVLARPVTSDDFPTADDALMLACIGPERAREVFLSALVWSIQSDAGIVIGDQEIACLRESIADIDVIGMAESPDDSPEALAFIGMFGCLGDAFLSLVLMDSGVEFEDLSDGELACLREWQAGADWDGLAEAADPEAAFEEFFAWSFGWFECLPEQTGFDTSLPPGEFSPEEATPAAVGEPIGGGLDSADDTDLFVFEAVEGESYDIGVEPGTLEDPTVALYDPDGWQLDYDDDSGGSLAPRLFWSADGSGPFYVEVGGYGAGSYTLTVAVSDVDDDHANAPEGATEMKVGEPAGGSVEYDGDVDYFVFEAVEGESYDIGVSPGTLEDPTVGLYDADGWYLDYDDDSGGALAPRLFWSTDISGPFHVEVGGYGTGSYTLTVARR